MAGIVVPVIPKTTFDFSNTGVGLASGLVPIGVPIDITQYPCVGLVARLHSASIDSTSFFNVQLADDGFLDGSAEAFPGSLYGSYQFISFLSTDIPPKATFFYGRNQGQYVSAGIYASRGAGTDPIIASVSVDLYLQNGDETPMILDNGVWRPASPIDPKSLYASASSGSIPAIRGGGWSPQESSSPQSINTNNAAGAGASPHGDQQTAASTIFKQQNEGPGPISLNFRGYRDPWDVK